MKAKASNFLYEELSYKIRGCTFKVYNTLGFGHKEDVYQKALAFEFKEAGMNFETEKALPVIYHNKKVGIYRPDFIVEKKVIIEIKAVQFIPKDLETQLTHYLKGTNYKLRFLINFGSSEIDIRRRIWTPSYQR